MHKHIHGPWLDSHYYTKNKLNLLDPRNRTGLTVNKWSRDIQQFWGPIWQGFSTGFMSLLEPFSAKRAKIKQHHWWSPLKSALTEVWVGWSQKTGFTRLQPTTHTHGPTVPRCQVCPQPERAYGHRRRGRRSGVVGKQVELAAGM